MHKTVSEAQALAAAVRDGLESQYPAGVPLDVVLCPPFTALAAVAAVVGAEPAAGGSTPLAVGAQDCFWEPQGAYTGAISVPMLLDAGCRYVIVGHSERRQYFHETDDDIGRKARAAQAGGLVPIICVGENLTERQQHKTFDVVRAQLEAAVASLESPALVVAYEPVWAIGSGTPATPQDAQEVAAFIRGLLSGRFGAEAAGTIRILYGGSVKPANMGGFAAMPDIDGALVGGASLAAADFLGIVGATAAVVAPSAAGPEPKPGSIPGTEAGR